jgi:hypothetical protein
MTNRKRANLNGPPHSKEMGSRMRVGSRGEVAARNYSRDVNAEEDDRERRLILPEAVPREALETTWMQ